MKKIKLLIIGLTAVLPTMAWAAGGVEGSHHDFSTNSVWNTRKGVCSPCHAAHNTDPAQIVPLWAHATTTGPFTMYSSPSLDAASPGSPDGASLACLSCHDGTVGINELISGVSGTNGVFYIDPDAQIGPDLHVVHPISITYDTALALADGGLEDPSSYTIGSTKSVLTVNTAPVPASWSGTSLTGKTIEEAMLTDGKVQCTSCHDPHKLIGSAPTSGIMVKISGNDADGRGSLICRTCHIK